jgi:hypothetical protein
MFCLSYASSGLREEFTNRTAFGTTDKPLSAPSAARLSQPSASDAPSNDQFASRLDSIFANL